MSKPEVILTLRPERVQLQAVADRLPDWAVAGDGESLSRIVRCASVDHAARLLGLLGAFEGEAASSDLTVGVHMTLGLSAQPALVDLARALDRVSADFTS